jgi:hypothetical protein
MLLQQRLDIKEAETNGFSEYKAKELSTTQQRNIESALIAPRKG